MPTHPIDEILARLKNVKPSGKGWSTLCPAHEDRQNSLSISVGNDGIVLVHCFVGCTAEAIVMAVGLSLQDLFPESLQKLSESRTHTTGGPPVTVNALARDKGLPTDFLQSLGLEDRPDGVLIPYRTMDGSFAPRQRLRKALKAKEGSLWLPGDGKPVPYGLERLADAQKAWFVILVEGESDCWTLWHHEFPALGIPGAEMYGKLELSHLEGIKQVYIVKEPDRGGYAFLAGLAKRLNEIGWKGEAFQLPFREVKDVNDLYKREPAKFKDSFQQALYQAEPLVARKESHRRSGQPKADGEDDPPNTTCTNLTVAKPTQAEILLSVAEDAELFHDPSGEPYVTFRVDNHFETWSTRKRGFRRWLVREFYKICGKPPSSQPLQDSIGLLESRALFDGPEYPVSLRVAEHNGTIYLDLSNPHWEVLEITPAGWRVVPNPPVKFRRARGIAPLPRPERGGSIEELRSFLNVASEADWRMVVAWIVQALRPRGPYPVLVLNGEHGSAKSTMSRVLRGHCDPNTTPLRALPRDGRDLMIAATNSWCICFDNLSNLQPWLSDAICRLATGGGFSTRMLYENDEEMLFEAQRPVILNGIGDIATRSDLLDRSLIITLPEISDESRRDEETFWTALEGALPRILGCLLDAVMGAMLNIGKTRLASMPRMADFALWSTAAEPALGWKPGEFLNAYSGNREDINELALDSSPVVAPLRELGDFSGTATELLEKLNGLVDEKVQKQEEWPHNPQALRGQLNRLAPNLRAVGFELKFWRDSSAKRRRMITLRKRPDSSVQVVQTVQTVENTDSVSDTSSETSLPLDDPCLPLDGEVDGIGPL